jgi:hypothetical protein
MTHSHKHAVDDEIRWYSLKVFYDLRPVMTRV